MKEIKRIISLAMVLILCVSLLPMNQNLIKAEETVDENADEFSISAKVFDGEKWVDAKFDTKFDLKKVRYNIKLDQNYKKIQFFINRTKDTKKVILNCTDTYNITNNYSEALAIPAGESVFFFAVDPYTNNLRDRYGFIVNRISSIGSIPHKIKTNNAYPECEVAYEGDIIKIKACTKTYNDKVFDKWIINSGNFEMENQGMNFTQFTMPNRDVEISSSYKEGDVNNSNLRNIYVHALKDSIWEIFNIQIDSNNTSGIYNIDLKKEYSEVYLTLQEEGVLLDGNTKEQALIHLNITKDNKLIDIAEYAKYFDTEKVKLDNGENIFNINVVSKDNSSTSNYTLKINNGEVKYTVTFNSNGAEGTMQSQKIKKGEKCTLPENGFTPPKNKKFVGWKIGNETKLVGDKITVNGNTEVTAIWKDIEYKVTFNNNEGTGDMDGKLVKAGEDFELPDCTFTAPDGQEFKAWEVDGQEYPAKAKIKINKETTIKAIWKDKTTEKFTVTINPNNNGINKSKTEEIKKGEDFELPDCTFTAPDGQEFKTWEVDGQEYPAKAKIKINKETTVKAIWQAKPIAPKPEDENKKYEIKLTSSANGKILLNPKKAKEGELVTVQAVPDYGYELESILILDENQKLVPMKANQFTMPKGAVSIYVKFRELAPAIYPEIDEEKPIENKRHRRDWYYKNHNEEKNPNEEKFIEEKEIIVKESKTIITIGSQTLEKVMNGVSTVKNMDSAPYIKRGRTMLPLRYLAEALGYKVFWLNETKTVVIVDLGLRVEIPIDTNLIIVNGIKYTSDVNPEIVHHRTMLPIANIARALGLKDGEDILWDEVNRQVTINKKSNK